MYLDLQQLGNALTNAASAKEVKDLLLELKDRVYDSVGHSSIDILQHLLPVLRHIIDKYCGQVIDNDENRACQAILEIFGRLLQNDSLKPYIAEIISICLKVIADDNEDNAVLCLKLFFELHKSYRGMLDAHVMPFVDLVLKNGRNIPTSISDNITNVPTATTSDSTIPTLTASHSFKVLGECPMIIIFLAQSYNATMKPTLSSLISLMISILSINTDGDLPSPGQVKRHKELITAQVKIMSFVCYFLRGYSDIIKQYETTIAKRLFELLHKCPADDKNARRELLIATRLILASEYKASLFPYVNDLLSEQVLLGHEYSDQLKQQAYSIIYDVIQLLKGELTLNHISRIITMFGTVLHNNSLPVTITGMSVKILCSLIERLGVLRKSPVDGPSALILLQAILRAFILKLGCIRSMKSSNDGSNAHINNGSTWLKKLIKSDSGVRYHSSNGNEMRIQDNNNNGVEVELTRPAPDSLTADVNIREVKQLIKAIVWNLKHLLTLLCDHQSSSSTQTRFGDSDESSRLLQNLFVWGLECCAIFANNTKASSGEEGVSKPSDQAELKEIVESFSTALLALDPRVIRLLLHSRFSTLYKLSITNPVLLMLIQHMLQQAPICVNIIDIILSFFIYNMDDLTHSRGQSACLSEQKKQMQRTSTLLRILKMVITAVNSFSDSVNLQALFQTRLRYFIIKSIRLAHASKAPFNYCYVLRLMFRGISSSPKAIAEQSMNIIKPLYPSILEGFTTLLKRSEHKSLSDLLVELCLTVPVHVKIQLENLLLLLPHIPYALRSQSETINLAFKSMESWLENTSLKAFVSAMETLPGLKNEIISAIYIHLRPSPYPFGIVAFKLLSRLGIVLNESVKSDANLNHRKKYNDMLVLDIHCAIRSEEKQEDRMQLENSMRLNLISIVEGACEMLECLKTAADPTPSEAELYTSFLCPSDDWVIVTEGALEDDMELQFSDSGEVCIVKKSTLVEPLTCTSDKLLEALSTFESSGSEGTVNDFNPKQFIPQIALISSASYLQQKRCAFDILWVVLSNVILRGDSVDVRNEDEVVLSCTPQESSFSATLEPEIDLFQRIVFSILLASTESSLKTDATTVLNGLCTHFAFNSKYDSGSNEIYFLMNTVIIQALSDARPTICQGGTWLLHKWLVALVEANQESIAAFEFECHPLQDLIKKSCEACTSTKWISRVAGVKVIYELCTSFSSKLPRKWFSVHTCHILQGLLAVFNFPVQEIVAARDDIYRTLKSFIRAIWDKESSPPSNDALILLVDGLFHSSSLSRMAAKTAIDEIIGTFDGIGHNILQEVKGYAKKVLDLIIAEMEQHKLLSDNYLSGIRYLFIYKLIDLDKPVVTIVSCAMDVSDINLPLDPSTGLRKVLDYSSSDNAYEEDYQLLSSLFPYVLPNMIEHQLHTIRLIQSIFITDTQGQIFREANQSFAIACISYLSKSIICGNTWIEIVVEATKALSAAKTLAAQLGAESTLPFNDVRKSWDPLFHAVDDIRSYCVSILKGFEAVVCFLPAIHHATIADKLLINLQLWCDVSFMSSTASSIWSYGEEQNVGAHLINLIQHLQVVHFSTQQNCSTLQAYVDKITQTVINMERMRYNFYYCNCIDDSPYLLPLAKILVKFPNEAINFFFNPVNICKAEVLSCFVALMRLDNPLVHDIIAAMTSDAALLIFERDVLFTNPTITHFQVQAHLASKFLSSSESQSSSEPELNASRVVDTSIPLQVYLDAAVNGSTLLRSFAKSNPRTLSYPEGSKFAAILRRLWSRIVPKCSTPSSDDFGSNFLNSKLFQEAKVVAEGLLEYCKLNPGQPHILFELIDIFSINSCPASFGNLVNYLKVEIPTKYSWNDKRNILQQFFHVFVNDKAPPEWKVKSMQILIYPLTQRILEDINIRELVFDSDLIRIIMQEAAGVSKTAEVLSGEGSVAVLNDEKGSVETPVVVRVELLKLSTILLEYIGPLLRIYKKEMIKYPWNSIKSEDYATKYWSYVNICRFVAAFDSPSKIIIQVYVALLRACTTEGKEIVRYALDILIPVLPFRINGDDMMKIIKWTKKIIYEEGGANMVQLIHIWQMIVRHGDVFYPYRSTLIPLIISSISRIGLPQTTTAEVRHVALNMADLSLNWEWYRRNKKIDARSNAQTSSPSLEVSSTGDNNGAVRDKEHESSCLSLSMVHVLANFLLRLGLQAADTKDASMSKVYSTSLYLFKKMLRLFDSKTLKIPYFDKLIQNAVESSSFTLNPANKPPTSSSTSTSSESAMLACLEFLVHSFDSMNRPSLLFSTNINSITELLPYLYNNDNARFQKGMNSLIVKVLAVKDDDFDALLLESGFLQRLNALIDNGLRSSQGAVSDNRRLQSMYCLDELCRSRPEWIDVFGQLLLTNFQSLLAEQIARGGKHSTRDRNSLIDTLSAETYPSPWATLYSENIGRTDATRNDKYMDQGFLQQQKREVLNAVIVILEHLDCAITLNEVSKFCRSWLGAKSPLSVLSINEKWLVYTKIVAYVDKHPENVAQPYYVRFLSIVEIVGSQYVKSPRDFSRSLGKPQSDSPDVALGLLGLWSPLKELRAKTQSRVYRFWGTGLYDKLIAFFRTNMEPFSARHLAILLPSLFFNSIDCLSTRFNASIAFRPSQQETSKAHVFGAAHAYNQFIKRSNGIKSDWKSLLENFCDLSLYHPLVGRAIWSSVLQQVWVALSVTEQRQLCVAFEGFVLRNKPKEHILWPLHVPNKHVRNEYNLVQVLLQSFSTLTPTPEFSVDFLGACGKKYSAWYDAIELLSSTIPTMPSTEATAALSVLTNLYDDLDDRDGAISSNRRFASDPSIDFALSFQSYGYAKSAQTSLFRLIRSYQSTDQTKASVQVGVVGRWIDTAKDLSQWKLLSDLADKLQLNDLGFEVAALNNDWDKLKRLRVTPTISAESDVGKIEIKLCDVMLSIVDSKHAETEKLCVQSIQMVLNRWQQLPEVQPGSYAHKKVLHHFQRIMEYRDSFSVIVECIKAIREKKLHSVNLKRLRDLWRNRVPDDSLVDLQAWHTLMQWRILTFERIKAIYSISPVQAEAQRVCDDNDDSPWCILKLAKVARKQSMFDVSMSILSRLNEMNSMDVEDAFNKLREQIFVYHSSTSNVTVALDLIDSTNTGYFSPVQKAELSRLKALCYIKCEDANKANDCFVHSTNLCSSHAKTWLSWGNFAYDNIPQVVDLSNVDNVITSIVCILKAIEFKSNSASALLGRVVWLMTEKWGQDPRVIKAFDDRNKSIPWWLWLPFLPIIVRSCGRGHGSPFKSILEVIAINNPNAIIYYLLSERDSQSAVTSSDVTQLLEKLGGGLEGLIVWKATWVSTFIKEITTRTWLETIFTSFVANFRGLSTNFSANNTFVESIHKSLTESLVDNRYSDLQKKIRDDFDSLNQTEKYQEDATLELLTFLIKWIKILIITVDKTEHRKLDSNRKFAENIIDVFNISQHPCLFSTNATTARFLEVKGLDCQHLDIPGRNDTSLNSQNTVKVKLIRIQTSTKLYKVNNVFYRRVYFIGNDGRSYAFNAGHSDLSNQSVYNIMKVLNWTLMEFSLGKKSNLILKSMISPIPITNEIFITRVVTDDYACLNDLFKDRSTSTGLDYFSPIIEGRKCIAKAIMTDPNNINAGKIAAYEFGKPFVPMDLLLNYFFNQWNVSIDYYLKRRIFCHDLGLNGAFQLLINANSLNADEFIITHDGHVDCGFYSTSYVNETENNRIILNDFDHVAIRLTRNIQKVVSFSSDIIVSIIGCSFDAFISNLDVIEIGLQFYFVESLRSIQVDIPEGPDKEEELIQCAKQLTKATLRKLRLYAPQIADKRPIDNNNMVPIDFNIKEVVAESMNEENIALMNIAEWIPLL